MSINSDFLGSGVTIDDDLLGGLITQDDMDAADAYVYGIARRLEIDTSDLQQPNTSWAVKDLIKALACQRRAGLKAGRQPYGEDDAYMSKCKYYSKEIARLTNEVQAFELTGQAPTVYNSNSTAIGLVRG